MNSLLTREDILRADREAVAVASREPSILFRLFGSFRERRSTGPQDDVSVLIDYGVAAPIIAFEEINDNGMVFEAILKDFCKHLGLDPSSTITHHHLMGARLGETPTARSEEFVQFSTWFKADVLPKNFRRVFVEYIVVVDELEGQLSNLSQYRWERLREWSNAHV